MLFNKSDLMSTTLTGIASVKLKRGIPNKGYCVKASYVIVQRA